MERLTAISFIPSSAELEPRSIVGGGLSTVGVAPTLARSPSALEREESRRRMRELSTRLLNVGLALALFVLALPLMALIALAVKITSRGPVLYTQDRVGLNQRRGSRRWGVRVFENDRRRGDRGGRIFKIYKFRTMRVEGSESRQLWAKKEDPRVTAVGRILRAHRLDELPQLINVLKGDMNLVGPRPEQPEIFEQLRKFIDAYPQRQAVRPGITGWAQVNRGYDEGLSDVRRKLHLDLEYVRRQSVAKDLLIIAKTPQVMLFKQGSQ